MVATVRQYYAATPRVTGQRRKVRSDDLAAAGNADSGAGRSLRFSIRWGWRSILRLAAATILALDGLLWAATHQVAIVDDEFEPKTLVVAPGDTVVWTNTTGSAHSVIADDGSFASTDSGQSFIPLGQTFTHTFPNVGRNPYYCQLHGGPGGLDMAGVIRVVDPSVNTPPAKPLPLSPAPGASDQSIAPTLIASAFSDPDAGDTQLASQWLVRNAATGASLDTGEDLVHKTTLPLSDLTFSTTYFWTVRYRDDRGAWSEYSNESSFTTVAEQQAAGTGLSASYGKYLLRTGTATILATAIDPSINFDWKLAKPHPKAPSNNFFVRWEGKVTPEFSERFRFLVRADGGVRLWINGQPIIDDWVAGKFAIYRNGLVNLEAGVPAAIRLEYFDTAGLASVSLRWSSRSRSTEVIPQTRLFPLTP